VPKNLKNKQSAKYKHKKSKFPLKQAQIHGKNARLATLITGHTIPVPEVNRTVNSFYLNKTGDSVVIMCVIT